MSNFFAFCLPLLLFFIWGTFGQAALCLLGTRRNLLQNTLLAPALGLCITLLSVFSLNRIGIPVGQFAIPLTICLLILSLFIFIWKKPIVPIIAYLPFAAVLLIALWMVGRPLLTFGFNWVSYSNDDMANYCLGALRFLHSGFFSDPDLTNLMAHRDYSQNYWYMYVASSHRAGSELVLAWVSGITKLLPIKTFMATIVGLHLTLISASGALVCSVKRFRTPALATCLLLAFSALTSLGTLYQLIAQVGGLSMLIAGIILLSQSFNQHRKWLALCNGILIAFVLSAMLVYYPEIFPFLVLSYFVYVGLQCKKGWRPNKAFWKVTLCSAVFLALFLNSYLRNAIFFVLHQTQNGTSGLEDIKASLFPYYLTPTGLANLWGLQAIASYPLEPHMSETIALGGLLCVSAFVITFRLLRQLILPAIIATVMLSLGIGLFIHNSDFGLFKLAMYVQPFLIGTVCIAIFTYFNKKYLKALAVIALIACGWSSQAYYLERSGALTAGGLTEIVYASNLKINQEFSDLIAPLPANSKIITDDFNVALLKFQAFDAVGKELDFVTYQPFHNIITSQKSAIQAPKLIKLFYPDPHISQAISKKTDQIENQSVYRSFNMLDPKNPKTNDFTEVASSNPKPSEINRTYLVEDTAIRTTLNRRQFDMIRDHNFVIQPWRKVKNHLIFVSSEWGPIYYAGGKIKTRIALNNVERDVYYPDDLMQAIRRYLLFRVVNPTEKFRFVVNITDTWQADSKNKVPSPSAIGNKRVPFFSMGRGSGRIFSQPVSAQIVAGIPYVALDMNAEGTQFSNNITGLLKLYGTTIPRDYRTIVGYTREISLLTEDEYQHLHAPSLLARFPEDLKNFGLEYSGIYEDSWISEDSFFDLKQPKKDSKLVVKGLVPLIGSPVSGKLIVLVDNVKVLEKEVKTGNFNFSTNVPYKNGRRKVELHFTKKQQLPNGDNRWIGGKLEEIGFV